MDFRILGPLEVRDGDREVRLRGGKQRALLALLLVNANRTLAIDRIVDELWGEDVPESAPKMVQIYVSKLAQGAGAGDAAHAPARLLPPARARRARPPPLRAARRRGPHRASTPAGPKRRLPASAPRSSCGAGRRSRSSRRSRSRRRGGEARGASDLRARGPGRSRSPARAPRRSRRRARGADRPLSAPRGPTAAAHAGALPVGPAGGGAGAYQRARRALADELGIEPSPALRELERRILQQDPSLDLTSRRLPRRGRRHSGDVLGPTTSVGARLRPRSAGRSRCSPRTSRPTICPTIRKRDARAPRAKRRR